MANNINLPDIQYMPPEFELDEYHPDNQEFMHQLQRIRKAIVDQTLKMTPWHVGAVKDKLKGLSNNDIAVIHEKAAGSVCQVLKREDALTLRAMLQHYQTALDGPGDAQRARLLWEIALDNQAIEPKVSISAIVEINKMTGAYDSAKVSGDINITINNNQFPRGKLDG